MANKSNVRVLRDLGKIIHEERIARGYSQQELSEKTGLSRYYISSIENGSKNVTVSVLRQLAVALKSRSWRFLQRAEAEAA